MLSYLIVILNAALPLTLVKGQKVHFQWNQPLSGYNMTLRWRGLLKKKKKMIFLNLDYDNLFVILLSSSILQRILIS